MKRILTSFLFFVVLYQTIGYAAAEEMPAVYDMSLEVQKNTTLDSLFSAVLPEDDSKWLFKIDQAPQHGEVTITNNKEGTFTYTPDTDYLGTDEFTFYLVSETVATDESERATVTLTVKETVTSPSPEVSPSPVTSPSTEPSPEKPPVYLDMWNHWGEYSAVKLTELEKLHGETIGGVSYLYPEEELTRIRFIILANGVFDYFPGQAQDLPFVDIAAAPPWVLRPLDPAYEHKLIKGSLENGQLYLFPYNLLTRVEACMMIYNALALDAHNTDELTFADKDNIPLWAVQMVKDMVGYGMIQGNDDNTFLPFKTVTKAEAIQMLYQAYQYKKEHPNVSPSPVVSPEVSPSVSPEVSPTVSPEASPSVSPEVSPTVSPEVSPSVSPEVSPTVS